jgi:hypothetical protein
MHVQTNIKYYGYLLSHLLLPVSNKQREQNKILFSTNILILFLFPAQFNLLTLTTPISLKIFHPNEHFLNWINHDTGWIEQKYSWTWCLYDRASLEQRCKQPTRCKKFRLLIFLNQPYMFRRAISFHLNGVTGWQQCRCVVSKAVYAVKKCSLRMGEFVARNM